MTTRIVGSRVIEVQWRIPATPNGVIIRYTVYVTPLSVSVGAPASQVDENNTQATQFVSKYNINFINCHMHDYNIVHFPFNLMGILYTFALQPGVYKLL